MPRRNRIAQRADDDEHFNHWDEEEEIVEEDDDVDYDPLRRNYVPHDTYYRKVQDGVGEEGTSRRNEVAPDNEEKDVEEVEEADFKHLVFPSYDLRSTDEEIRMEEMLWVFIFEYEDMKRHLYTCRWR